MDKLRIKENLEFEILSCMISNPDSIKEVYQKVKESDFSKDNKELFSELIQIDSNMDTTGIILELSKKNLESWSYDSLTELMLKDVSFESLIYNKIFERFKDLTYSIKAEEILKDKIEKIKTDFCGLDTISELQSDIETILKSNDSFKIEKSFSESLTDIFSEIETEIISDKSQALKTKNFPSFNNCTGGLRPGNLCGIAGAYKSGKTTLSLNIILDYVKQNIPCGYISLEMNQTELNRKLLGMLSNISYEVLREPKKLQDKEKSNLSDIYKSMKNYPLYISDNLMSETDIRSKAKFWKEKFNIQVVCIDYIGLIKSKKKFESREREMSFYSEYLKLLAKELNIIVIALAQLNRTGRKQPGTENLAESIGLARDCDFLFITYNPFEIDIKQFGSIKFTESDFICRLDTTRHTKHKKSFLLRLEDSGNFNEIASEFDNSYMNTGAIYSLIDNDII